ncbi:hypothetical protein [Rhodoferax sp.]|uniref:hypothetical protein n=1 Tax=Rhodoferax sp. TaxID=50421 RepID=UPI002848390B|nr:hypothetical protein [Rhodoferax sp.]MDR3369270.1 hypothetical protein [Rhodoferax sp.]
MQKPETVKALEEFGRERLSKSFFMRDFLFSDIATIYGIPNTPDNPDLAIEVGRHLCVELLEPLNTTFGRVAIRSAYRSSAVNQKGNDEGDNCAKNESNYAGHIWDHLDKKGQKGATACVVVPWFADRYDAGADWRAMAYWIHDHLPYSELQFFPKLAAFNISWHESPKRKITSYIEPRKIDISGPIGARADLYADFPKFRKA